ncbi:MAG: hypothetical protein RIR53_1494 [Bacteroidota bacterium]
MITVHPYTAEHRQEWDAFVESSNNGTMFHLQRFLDYHPEGKWNWHHLMFRQGDKLVGVLPGGINAHGAFWSPTGASYGSICIADCGFERSLEIVDAFIDYCKGRGILDAYLIPAPLIYTKNYDQHHEYAMLYRKAGFELHYISHAIDLKHGQDYFRHFSVSARRNINRALRDPALRITESDDYETFHRILVENKAKHDAKPTHSLDDLYRLRELVPDKLRLTMVYHNDEPIAGSLVFIPNRKVALCFYNMLRYEYEHLHPIYLILNETCQWAVENGFEWVDIGVSQDTKSDNPMTPSLSLINFKERFDARGILRSTYHLDLR